MIHPKTSRTISHLYTEHIFNYEIILHYYCYLICTIENRRIQCFNFYNTDITQKTEQIIFIIQIIALDEKEFLTYQSQHFTCSYFQKKSRDSLTRLGTGNRGE